MAQVPSDSLTANALTISMAVGNPTLALWVRRRQRAQEYKQLFEPAWTKYWRWYRAIVTPLSDPADWWRSNEVVPTVFKIVETLLPRHIMGIFDSPQWFVVEARQRRDEQYEMMCEALLQATVEDMDIFPKLYEAIKYSLIMGHCWGKVTWREEYTERRVMNPSQQTDPTTGQVTSSSVDMNVVTEEVYNNVDFDWRPLDRIFPDPTGEGQWFVEEIDTTLEKLLEAQDQMDGQLYDRDELARLVAGIPPGKYAMAYGGGDSLTDARSGTSAGVSVEYAREPMVTEGIPNELVSPMRDGVGIKLWQCWGWVPPKLRNKDKAAWRLTVIAEGRYILRDEPSPTPDGKPPYFPIKSIPIPGLLYGESIIHYIGPMADQQTRLANMRLDECYTGVWGQYIYRKSSLAGDNSLLFQPGGAIPVITDPGQSINDVFTQLPRLTVLPEHYTEDQYRQTQAEYAAAASDIMQGVSSSDRQTATEVERRLQQGNARHMLQVLWNDYTVKKELLSRTWRWLQMRLTKDKQVRITGEEYAMVNLQDIQIPIDIVVSGGMFALSKDTRVQMSQELVQIAASPAFTPWMNIGPILRRLLQDRGWKDPDAYVKTDQQVMVEQTLMQMGAMGAQGGPGQAQQQAGQPNEQQQQPGAAAKKNGTPPGGGAGNGQGIVGAGGGPEEMPGMRGEGAQNAMAGGAPQGSGHVPGGGRP